MHEESVTRIDQAEIRFLIEKNADGIIVVDDEGVVLFANPAAEQLFGRPHNALLGSPIGVPVMSTDAIEITIHRPGGDQVDAEIRVVETVWDRRPARLASLRDTSARKTVEERMRHAAKMEAIGRLTAGIAHDFNNLLTVVLGNLEHAQRKEIADASLRRNLENATAGAKRAAVLTSRLLSFARQKPLEPQVLDVNDLVLGLSDLLRRTLGENVQVRTSLTEDVCCVEIDPAEMESALLNLAVNARDAMPSGGELLISTQCIDLDSASAAAHGELEPGAYVMISVSDTGHGMAPDVLRQVFEPFFTTKAERGGTGLGLSQVYGFVRQSGGQIKLYSEIARGTTVRIYLPQSSATPAAQPQSAAQDVPHATDHEVVLLVEDNDEVRAYAAASLRELGYRVIEAPDAPSALKILKRKEDVSLLFTDLGLPGGMDGKALSDKARKLRPQLPVLITTAYAGGTRLHEGGAAGDVQFLAKPFNFEMLATRIRDAIHASRPGERRDTILLVEDEPLVRMFLIDLLQERKFDLLEAGSIKEAMAAFQDAGGKLSGAIIDFGLPDGSGEDLFARLRSLDPRLPVILATGFADQGVQSRYEKLNGVRVLSKPVDQQGLVDALRELGIERQR